MKANQRLPNFIGLVIKLSLVPLLVEILNRLALHFPPGTNIVEFAWFLILIGFAGILFSDMLMLRFGDGSLHFSSNATRLVDVGIYARNRHPSFWFFSIYQLGMILLYFGFNLIFLSIWASLVTINIVVLLYIQEPHLSRSLGMQYDEYRDMTPFAFWKIQIPRNNRIRFLPQVIWIFARIFIRNWYKIKVLGIEHIPLRRPFIVVANHESYLDPFLFSMFLPFEIQFVTTADVFTTPIMRLLLKGIGTFPMRRHRQDLKSIRTMIRLVKSGQVVGIFPEGGRSIDGSPLPILKETVKLIQHCKVPILPIHIDGAYEIWPRWASNRRRGKVVASFRPVIPVADQADLNELEKHIKHSIFNENKIFNSVKSHAISQGLNHFLWACIRCKTHNAIRLKSKNYIQCDHCKSEWEVTNNYTLQDHHSNESYTLVSWISGLKKTMLEHQLTFDPAIKLHPGERVFLDSTLDKYSNEKGLELAGDLNLTLSSTRLILSQGSKIIDSWFLESVTIFTMDYHNAVSIGVSGLRHTFFLPKTEISLKWQNYFDALYARLPDPEK